MARWKLIVISVAWLAGIGATPGRAETRIALIVTNQNYSLKELKLENTHRDGDLMKRALEADGFQVYSVKDTPTQGALLEAIGAHIERLAKAGPDAVGFFYYSGHGAADGPKGANYLIPTEASLTHAAQLPLVAVSLDSITASLAQAGKMSFVVFDACRNFPLQRADKALFKGFAPYQEQRGLLVAFATEPGSVAADQSIYARVLAEQLVKPGLEAGQAFRAVTRRVLDETANAQEPEFLDKRRGGDFYFTQAPASAGKVTLPATPAAAGGPTTPAAPTASNPSNDCASERCPEVSLSVRLPLKTVKDCALCPEMVVVPAGCFMMGSPDGRCGEPPEEGRSVVEGPRHKVTIAHDFAIGKYAVTFAQWDAAVAEGGVTIYPNDEGWGREDRPVINVRWSAAKDYVKWLRKKTGQNYRLPSEAEWEYAARAGTPTPFWFGKSISVKQANYNGNFVYGDGENGEFRQQTLPVKWFEPNRWGLYQVHGNVAEWVEDCWNDSLRDIPADGSALEKGNCALRVVRGGSWNSKPQYLRSAKRGGLVANVPDREHGFRVAKTLESSSGN